MKFQTISLALLLLLGPVVSLAAELVTLQTRPGVEQRFILITPEKPIASVILFAGGKGVLDLSSAHGAPLINWGKNNFLVRTRNMFVKHGFVVAVVDAPSDQQSSRGMLGGFRDSGEHVQDIDDVINYLRKKTNTPVWLIGTSRGTESVTNVAINSEQNPSGLILTSSMSVQNHKGTAVTEMDLESITIPTLVVAHTDDGCSKTPSEGAEEIAGMLSNAEKVEVKLFSGGDTLASNPCKGTTYHGFLGIEVNVIDYIADFIRGR